MLRPGFRPPPCLQPLTFPLQVLGKMRDVASSRLGEPVSMSAVPRRRARPEEAPRLCRAHMPARSRPLLTSVACVAAD